MDAKTLSENRLRALVEAGVALTSELSLDALLQRLVEAAAELTAARYAALGVIDRSGSELERFLTTGMDAETHVQSATFRVGEGSSESSSLRTRRSDSTILARTRAPWAFHPITRRCAPFSACRSTCAASPTEASI